MNKKYTILLSTLRPPIIKNQFQNIQTNRTQQHAYYKLVTNRHHQLFRIVYGLNRISYGFTSSSNPTQVPLLQQVESKILQIIINYNPSLNQNLTNETQDSKTKNQLKRNVHRNKLFSEMGFDSLDVTEMIVSMQELFQIELTDQESLSIDSYGKAVDIFFSKINAKIMNKIIQTNYKQQSLLKSPLSQRK